MPARRLLCAVRAERRGEARRAARILAAYEWWKIARSRRWRAARLAVLRCVDGHSLPMLRRYSVVHYGEERQAMLRGERRRQSAATIYAMLRATITPRYVAPLTRVFARLLLVAAVFSRRSVVRTGVCVCSVVWGVQ